MPSNLNRCSRCSPIALPADLDETPDTGLPPEWERALSAPFVVHESYGTRCSSVLLVEHDGRTTMCERRFDAGGNTTGATRLEFATECGSMPGMTATDAL